MRSSGFAVRLATVASIGYEYRSAPLENSPSSFICTAGASSSNTTFGALAATPNAASQGDHEHWWPYWLPIILKLRTMRIAWTIPGPGVSLRCRSGTENSKKHLPSFCVYALLKSSSSGRSRAFPSSKPDTWYAPLKLTM